MTAQRVVDRNEPGGEVGDEENEAGGSDDEGLPLLHRHTKVRVSGNNRTKGSLVGLTGVVKKAVGLGGWHWLVLSNGQEVRLQRNALSVIQHPTGLEEDSDIDGEGLGNGNGTGGPGPNSTNGAQGEKKEATRTSRPKRPTRPPAEKQNAGGNNTKGIKDGRHGASGTSMVNFDKLGFDTLKKYRRHYKLDPSTESSKDKLVTAISNHFNAQKVDEGKVLTAFMAAVASSAQ